MDRQFTAPSTDDTRPAKSTTAPSILVWKCSWLRSIVRAVFMNLVAMSSRLSYRSSEFAVGAMRPRACMLDLSKSSYTQQVTGVSLGQCYLDQVPPFTQSRVREERVAGQADSDQGLAHEHACDLDLKVPRACLVVHDQTGTHGIRHGPELTIHQVGRSVPHLEFEDQVDEHVELCHTSWRKQSDDRFQAGTFGTSAKFPMRDAGPPT